MSCPGSWTGRGSRWQAPTRGPRDRDQRGAVAAPRPHPLHPAGSLGACPAGLPDRRVTLGPTALSIGCRGVRVDGRAADAAAS